MSTTETCIECLHDYPVALMRRMNDSDLYFCASCWERLGQPAGDHPVRWEFYRWLYQHKRLSDFPRAKVTVN